MNAFTYYNLKGLSMPNIFEELIALYDGSILGKVKFIESINTLNAFEIFRLTQFIESKFKDNLKSKIEPIQLKVESLYQNFINSIDKEMEFSFNRKNLFALDRNSSNFSWELDFYLKGIVCIENCKIQIDPELLAKQIKLRDTSTLISRQEGHNPNNLETKKILNNIQYLLGVLDLMQEKLSLETVKLNFYGKTEIIKINSTMFDQIFKIIFKEAGLRI